MEVQSLVKLINCRKGKYNNEKFITTVIKMTVAVVRCQFGFFIFISKSRKLLTVIVMLGW